MKKISTLLLIMCLAVASTTWAKSIDENQARNIATRFMASQMSKSATQLKLASKSQRLNAAPGSDKTAAYYVFNDGDCNGYVIIAGDDRAPAVLGYSDRGTFDVQDVPEAMQALLDSYAEQIDALASGAAAAPLLSSGAAITPLVHATWSQNNPYNILLPFRPDGKHSVAGCVATAMAQVMYYWQWPARPTMAIPEYTTETLHYYMPELPHVDFNWSEMQDTYLMDDTTSAGALAAATLTLYCAQSVEMDFLERASGASTMSIPWKMATYFGYKHSAHGIKRENYSSQEWCDIIYNELAENRPVIFSGSKKTGGHAFICDGYDGNGMFHFNWGWNGQSNGFFLMNVVNPDAQGTGSASGAYGYVLDQSALIGIEPGEASNERILTAADFTYRNAMTTRNSADEDFWLTASCRFHNLTSEVLAMEFGWGLYQGDALIKKFSTVYHPSLHPGRYVTLTDKTLVFGSGLANGTYRIVPICTEYDAENWRPCAGSDMNYIEVTINDNTCEYKGHGTTAERDYTINDVTCEGHMHNGRPVTVNVNMTNNGETAYDMLYMFADGVFVGAAQVGLLNGETGDISFMYTTMTAGDHQLTWSWNENGSNPIESRTITINAMPAANLSGSINVLNATGNYVINSNKFSFDLVITNNGNEPYQEDITVGLYKQTTNDGYGSDVQIINRPVDLAAGETATLHFDMDPVADNWQYFVLAYYYSGGQQQFLTSTSFYTIVFPEEPQYILGDVNGDQKVSIADVTALINLLLTNAEIDKNVADLNGDGKVTIGDVTSLINRLLTSGE